MIGGAVATALHHSPASLRERADVGEQTKRCKGLTA